eukprot:s8191_g2.t1
MAAPRNNASQAGMPGLLTNTAYAFFKAFRFEGAVGIRQLKTSPLGLGCVMSQMLGQLPKVKHPVHFNKMLGAASRRNLMDRKILKPPEAFSPATIEEEVSQWSDWAFTFKNFLAFVDQAFLTDLKSAEDQKVEISSDISNTCFGDDRERMNRGMKLYSVLSSYLRNRPLKVLRRQSPYLPKQVWRKLTAELEPSSRSRSLAMAQALVGFPAMSRGASLMDYVLTFEKLISEYEKISGTKYDDNLKKPCNEFPYAQNLKQHVMVDITDRTTYDEKVIKRAKVIKEKAEKVKETEEKEKDMEEEKVAKDQKEKEEVSEEVLEKEEEKERKVERMCGRLKEKATRAEKEKADKELFATLAVRPATLLLSVGRHRVEKEKEKVEKEKCGMFRKLEKKTGALIHKQAHQHSRRQEQHQQQKEMNKFDDWLPRLCLSLKKLMMMIM